MYGIGTILLLFWQGGCGRQSQGRPPRGKCTPTACCGSPSAAPWDGTAVCRPSDSYGTSRQTPPATSPRCACCRRNDESPRVTLRCVGSRATPQGRGEPTPASQPCILS